MAVGDGAKLLRLKQLKKVTERRLSSRMGANNSEDRSRPRRNKNRDNCTRR